MNRTRPQHRTILAATAIAVASVAALAVVTPASAVPERSPVAVTTASGEPVAGSYVVTLAPGSDARKVARSVGIRARHTYTEAIDGFAAPLDARKLAAVRSHPAVVAVEQEQVHSTGATQSVTVGGGLYGLDRIDQRALPLSGTYTYNMTASNVRAYVIDTGIATSHPNFGGRAQNVYDALGGNGQDCNGHGTHVAGTIGGSTYGVAKGVRLRGIRVLGCNGSGSTGGIIAAVDWLRVNAQRPAVANMSLGGGYSAALNTAVTNLANSGVAIAVAAGNENQNACNVSPASASGALTVAASDVNDTRASFSNFGGCTDLYAPGVSVTSTWLSGSTRTISGTSMASPHVAGVMALYKGRFGDAASSTVNSWIVNNSTANAVRSNVSGTPNRLLFTNAL